MSSSSSIDFLMLEQGEAKTTKLDMIRSSKMNIKMKKKLKRRRSSSRARHRLSQKAETRSSSSGVLGRRMKTLKELVPNSHKCMGVDRLFRETAEYILTLQLKVRVMQNMIDLVSKSGSD